MIVDTSALIAVLLGESEAAAFAEAMATRRVALSAATLAEARIVVESKAGSQGRRRLEALLETVRAETVPVDERQAMLATEAYRDYGRNSGSPARLNFGDCFSYALAVARRDELLFKGDDFGHTDIKQANVSVE